MRTFVSAVAVLLGLLLAAIAVPAIWVDRNIVQENGFVSLASPLGQDPAFQQRLAAAAVGSLNIENQVPGAFSGLVGPMVEAAASSLAGLPGYPAAWEETLRRSHRLSFADPGTLPPEADAGAGLTLDVAPLVALATEQISQTTRIPLEAPGQTLVSIGQASQRQVVEGISLYAPLGYAAAIGAGIAFLLALVAARRRWAVLVWAGLGTLVLAAVWSAGSDIGSVAVSAANSGNEVAEIFKQEFVAASVESFKSWIPASLVTGGILVAAGLLVRATAERVRR